MDILSDYSPPKNDNKKFLRVFLLSVGFKYLLENNKFAIFNLCYSRCLRVFEVLNYYKEK